MSEAITYRAAELSPEARAAAEVLLRRPLAEDESISIASDRPAGARPPEIDPDPAARRRGALIRLIEELAAMPPEGPSDGWSNRDHDRVLYGEPR